MKTYTTILLLLLLQLTIHAQAFIEQTGIALTGVSSSKAAWGDYDNDGLIDMLIIGQSSVPVTKLYHNDGNNSFSEETTASLTGITFGSIAWGDYDNDGYLDILMAGKTQSATVVKVYHNNGNRTFTELPGLSLALCSEGSVAWYDYNADGKLDILLTGAASPNPIAKIYKNYGNGTFTEQPDVQLQGVSNGSVAIGDYNNDSFQDLLYIGYSGGARFAKLYKNNGDGTLSDQTNNLAKVDLGSVDWGDYDNDGDLDILLTGATNTAAGNVSKIYKNNGNNSFSELSGLPFKGVIYSSGVWGDYNNDGYLDVMISGEALNNDSVQIYQNNRNGTFTKIKNTLVPATDGSCVWGDYDNDGRIDILITGVVGSTGVAKIYKNNTPGTNSKPSTPSNLKITIQNGTDAVLSWEGASDNETPQNGLSYNIYLYEYVTSYYKKSPQAITTGANNGKRLLSAKGTAQFNASGIVLKNLPDGTYKWSVQAVDNAFTGGAFAKEDSFTIVSLNSSVFNEATWQISNTSVDMEYSMNSSASGEGTWAPCTSPVTNTEQTLGCYEVWIRQKSLPSNRIKIDTTACNIFKENTNVSFIGTSAVAWGDYDRDGNLDILLSGATNTDTITKVYRNLGDGTFDEQKGISLKGYRSGTALWADYDHDGDLDILSNGYNKNKRFVLTVYRNEGNNNFTEQTEILVNQYSFEPECGDYDNDGDLDIIFANAIYTNNGNNSFIGNVNLAAIYGGISAWGDYNNDGYLDILLAGNRDDFMIDGTNLTRVYKNTGKGTFTTLPQFSKESICYGAVDFVDFNNDSFLDFYMNGIVSPELKASELHVNMGNNSFQILSEIKFPQTSNNSSSWGDFDNNGYPDLVIGGEDIDRNRPFKIYRNNGNNTFTELLGFPVPNLAYCGVAWGDYDNDGDLDLIITGQVNGKRTTKLFTNQLNTVNTPPSSPENLKAIVSKDSVVFTWDQATDSETSQKGLSYNLYLYNTDSLSYQRSSESFTAEDPKNGKLLLAKTGDIRYSPNGYPLKNLKSGHYKWSVQAIDQGLKGGPFAAEQTFTYINLSEIDLNIAEGKILHTSSEASYSFDSTDGTDGNWLPLSDSVTIVDFKTGGYDVWVKQTNLPQNSRKIASIKAQEAAPTYGIKYILEITDTYLKPTDEYSFTPDMSGALKGTGTPVNVTPGQNMYFRVMATDTTVASAIQTLIVDNRPEAPTNLGLNDNKNSISWTNNPLFPNYTNYEISVDSGKVWKKCTGNPYDAGRNAYPAGGIHIRIQATTTNFSGSPLISKYALTNTGIKDLQKLGILIFPNPVQNQLLISGMPETALLTIINQNGSSAKQIMLNAGNNEVLLNDIPSGVYILKINSKNLNIEYKIVKN